MDTINCPFDRASIPVHEHRGITHSKIKSSCQEMAKESFISGEEEVNWNQNSHVTSASRISPKPKTSDLLNFSDYQKVHPFVKTLFKETRAIFPLAGRLKYFLKDWEKVTNDSTILSIVNGCSIDFV